MTTKTFTTPTTGGAARAAAVVANENAAYRALSAVTTALAGARAQRHSLDALEASLLTMADQIATLLTSDGGYSDHGEFAHRAVAAELGAAVKESDRAIARKINQAVVLVNDYPEVHSALAAGSISAGHAKAITGAGAVVTGSRPEARAAYAEAALKLAESDVVGRVIPLVKSLAEQYAARSLDERYAQARECRMVRVVEIEDGMADLTATLPAACAHGIKDRLDQMAKRVKLAEVKREEDLREASANSSPEMVVRSMDQIRADLLTDMLLAGDPTKIAAAGKTGLQAIQARVQVLVPREHLTEDGTVGSDDAGGRTDRGTNPASATFEGYGPIDTETARVLAAGANLWECFTFTFSELLAGEAIQVDSYRPSVAQRQFLGARDQHCRFPGCRIPLASCEIDHTIDAALGGPTTTDNLAHLCVGHHGLKHNSAWKVRQDPDGTLHWTSPTGRDYTEPTPSSVRFPSTSTPAPDPVPPPDLSPQSASKSPPGSEQAHPF